MTHPVLVGILAVVNAPVYFFLGKLLFDDWENFIEAIRFWITPDLFSWIRGEGFEDWWAEIKLGVWVSTCFGAVAGECLLIDRYLL